MLLFSFLLCLSKNRGNIVLIGYLRILLLKFRQKILGCHFFISVLLIQHTCIRKCKRILNELHRFGCHAIP